MALGWIEALGKIVSPGLTGKLFPPTGRQASLRLVGSRMRTFKFAWKSDALKYSHRVLAFPQGPLFNATDLQAF
jgi:hypothetical protein